MHNRAVLGNQATAGALAEAGRRLRPAGPYALAWRRFRAHRAAMIAASVLSLIVLAVTIVPWLLPRDAATRITAELVRAAPSWAHPFGGDNVGRDILARCLWGGRISLTIGAVSVALAMTIGVTLGALAGFYGRTLDAVVMRFTDTMLAIPGLLLLILLTRIFTSTLPVIVVIIGVVSWMRVARLVRVNFLSLREQEFVAAAAVLGVRDRGIIFRHILPNTAGAIVVEATLGVGHAIALEAAASFLGVGLQPPTASWGSMLFAAQALLSTVPWVAFFPGLMIVVTVLCINLVGDGLRDALDPRTFIR